MINKSVVKEKISFIAHLKVVSGIFRRFSGKEHNVESTSRCDRLILSSEATVQ